MLFFFLTYFKRSQGDVLWLYVLYHLNPVTISFLQKSLQLYGERDEEAFTKSNPS